MITLKKILNDIWTKDIKQRFKDGFLIYERQLQAELYRLLKSHLNEHYEIWVEPVIYIDNKFEELRKKLNYSKPDIIVTYKCSIVAVIELKFTPWSFSHYRGDLEKLTNFCNAAQKDISITLGWKPSNPNWQKQKDEGKKDYPFSKELLTIFMVVSHPKSYALLKEEVLKSASTNFLHFVGWIDENSSITFKMN